MYDLDSPLTVTKNLSFFCNQFVHSYIFVEYFDDGIHIDGVFVSSDKERHKMLYFLEINQVIKIFEQVGNDHPISVTLIYSPNKKDYDVQSCSRSLDSAG